MYDVVIIGAGPAGITAGIYAKRAMLNTMLVEKLGFGGQAVLTDAIENYPGFSKITGPELIQKFEEHVTGLGLEITYAEIEKIEDKGDVKILHTTDDEKISTRSVIIASGAHPNKLGVPGETAYIGRGVSYCATCDGFFFTGKDVAVVGGGGTAITEAIFLAKMVNKVYVIHRRDALRAEKILQERAFNNPKIEFVWNGVVEEIKGKQTVDTIVVKDVKTEKLQEIAVDGVFVFVGLKPNTDFIDCRKDERGFIKTDVNLATSMDGVFAAGDCRDKPLRQVVTAVGDGAIASASVEKYLESM
jgi:thioredoxin reductase (NADPH)